MLTAAFSTQARIVPCAGRVERVNRNNVNSKSTFFPARSVATKAIPDINYILDIADAAPGSVDAPLPVVAGLAIVVSAAALLFFSLGLKPGKSNI